MSRAMSRVDGNFFSQFIIIIFFINNLTKIIQYNLRKKKHFFLRYGLHVAVDIRSFYTWTSPQKIASGGGVR